MQSSEFIHVLNYFLRKVIDYSPDNYFDPDHPMQTELELDELMENLAKLPNVIKAYRRQKHLKTKVNKLISNSKA